MKRIIFCLTISLGITGISLAQTQDSIPQTGSNRMDSTRLSDTSSSRWNNNGDSARWHRDSSSMHWNDSSHNRQGWPDRSTTDSGYNNMNRRTDSGLNNNNNALPNNGNANNNNSNGNTANSNNNNSTDSSNDKLSLEDRVMMKDGEMIIRRNGEETKMEKEIRFASGTVVTPSGVVRKKDGTETMLKDGQYIDLPKSVKTNTTEKKKTTPKKRSTKKS